MVAIPLPAPANEPAEGWIMGGLKNANALQRQGLENQYYGPLAEAEVKSKTAYANYLPYQLQAQAMANPMLWMAIQEMKKTNPEAANNMLRNLTQSLPNPQNMNAGNTSSRSNVSNGLLGLLTSAFSKGENPTAPVNALAGNGNADNSGMSFDARGQNVPASPAVINNIANNGNGSGAPAGAPAGSSRIAPGDVGSKMVQPYTQSPYDPGKTVNVDGTQISTPDSATTQAAQQSLVNIKNLKPVINEIARGAEKWLGSGTKGKVAVGQVAGWLESMGGNLLGIPDSIREQVGITKKDISDYAQWKSQQQNAVEMIIKTRGWANNEDAQHRVSEIMEPIPGEGKDYGNRVLNELTQLENSTARNAEVLNQGIDVTVPKSQMESVAAANIETAPEGEWFVFDPKGRVIARGPEKGVNELIKKHPGYYRKKTNG